MDISAMLLCASMLMNKEIDKDMAIRGCLLSDQIVSASTSGERDPYLIAAITWQESKFFTGIIGSSGECGAMQVLPRYSSFTCKQMQQGRGIEAGVRAFNGWMKTVGNVGGALERYNCGYRKLARCGRYRREVMWKMKSLKKAVFQFETNV